MLRLQDVSLMRGVRVLYSHATLLANPGERVGLVGNNGCGKSSLLAAILGEIPVEAGEITAPDFQHIGHVAQDIDTVDEVAIDWVLSGHAPLVAAKKALEEATDDMATAQAVATLAELNDGAITAQAKIILHGLGFTEEMTTHRVKDFSGGWRNRLALARALMCPAELLLLDEPTNHLDLDSVIWLEAWLKRQHATTIIISHDREFLDRTVSTIWSVEDNTIRRYAGNYSAFELLRVERLRAQDAAAKAYEKQSAHLQSFIDRFRYKATKARQAQSRIKMLEKLKAVEPVRATREWRFEFLKPERLPEHLVEAQSVALGYGDKEIIHDVKFSIRAGERIGVLGVNGAGKSTLIKGICKELTPMAGEFRFGQGLQIGYFAQHQLEQLRGDETPLQHLRRKAPDVREQELRNFLGRFRFSGDMVNAPVKPFSGGEKARLALALLAWDKPNLIVLDEPTNHLDMQTREALTMALSSFEGSLLLVSHDRHLLAATTDRLMLVHNGLVTEFDGDLDDYAKLVLETRKATLAAEKVRSDSAPSVNKKEARQQAALERQRIANLKKPLQKELAAVEKKLNPLSTELKALDAKLADTAFYTDGDQDEVAAALKRHGELSAQVEELEARWLELSEAIEAIV